MPVYEIDGDNQPAQGISGDGAIIAVNGSGNSVAYSGSNSSLASNGNNNQIVVAGSLDVVIANGSNTRLQITGDADALDLQGQSANVQATGVNNSLLFHGTGNALTMGGSGGSAAFFGTGNLIDVTGTGATIGSAGSVITFHDGSSGTVQDAKSGPEESGNDQNIIYVGSRVGSAATNLTLNGYLDTVLVTGNSSYVSFNGSLSSTDVSGTGNHILGNGDSLTVGIGGSGNDVVVNGVGTHLSITGQNETVTLHGVDSTTQLGGQNNSLLISGTGARLAVAGTGEQVRLSGGRVSVASGSSVTFNRDPDDLDFSNGNLIALADNAALTINGANNWVEAGANDTVVLNGTGNGVEAGAGAKVTLAGPGTAPTTDVATGNQYALMSGGTLTVSGAVRSDLAGDNNRVSLAGRTSLSVLGNGNSITAGTPGDTIAIAGAGNSFQGSGATISVGPQTPAPGTGDNFAIRGFGYASYSDGTFTSPVSAQSLMAMRATGANAVQLVVTQYVGNVADPTIARTSNTESDANLAAAIRQAQADGLQVLLKPQVDISSGPWRAYLGVSTDPNWTPAQTGAVSVGAPSTASYASQFFANYTNMMVGYAKVAQATGVQMLSLGSELVSLTGSAYRQDWLNLISAVRQVYTGKLTYSSSWLETGNVSFWDKVDVIGVNPYEAPTTVSDPTLDQLKAGWTSVSSNAYEASKFNGQSPVDFYKSLSAQYGKQVLFTEIGYRSVAGTNTMAGDGSIASYQDYQQQSLALQAFLDTFGQQPGSWVAGAYLWDWNPDPSKVATDDFSVQGKPAQNVVDTAFGGATAPATNSTPNTINGDSNSITAADGQHLTVSGSGNTVAVTGSGRNVVLATGGNSLSSTADGDLLTGSGGNDTLTGSGRGDTLIGGAGADRLSGVDAIVSYASSSAAVFVQLASGADEHGGDAEGDLLSGINGVLGSRFADAFYGNGGNNVFEGGAGADTIYGGGGNATASYASSSAGVTVTLGVGTVVGAGFGGDAQGDVLHDVYGVIGSAYADTLTGSGAGGLIDGGAGDDTLRAGDRGSDTLQGGLGNDRLFGGSGGTNTLHGGAGLDTLLGGSQGTNYLYGEADDDQLTGGDSSSNTLSGGDGNDVLVGGNSSTNTLSGDAGNDRLTGGYGAGNTLDGGDGNDTIVGGDDSTNILVGDGGLNVLTGGANSNNTIYAGYRVSGGAGPEGASVATGGQGGVNIIYASTGNDTITGGLGSDNTIYGGRGQDRADRRRERHQPHLLRRHLRHPARRRLCHHDQRRRL